MVLNSKVDVILCLRYIFVNLNTLLNFHVFRKLVLRIQVMTLKNILLSRYLLIHESNPRIY
mgnify:FL=1